MNNNITFTGLRNEPVEKGYEKLQQASWPLEPDPKKYITDPDLADAVRISIILKQPLLVTGAPGTGKTELAFRIAWELGYEKPLKYETKSTSIYKDLFYSYDVLGRFHAAQLSKPVNDLDFITYNALGEAIIQSNKKKDIDHILPEKFNYNGPVSSVVLIDEIDKAPRDFPNDILNEIEKMYFRIPELNIKEPICTPKDKHPLVIITSNSEKQLPDAFLRRCIFHYIEFPIKDRMLEIIEKRYAENNKFIQDAVELFYYLRNGDRLLKQASTGELLVWINTLKTLFPTEKTLINPENIKKTLGVLIKKAEDMEKAKNLVDKWIQNKK